jgi:hypothetical protein
LPFLNKFQNYKDVLIRYEEDGSLPVHTDGRGALVAAIINYYLRDKEKSNFYFDKAAEIAVKSNNKGFGEHVEKIRNSMNVHGT